MVNRKELLTRAIENGFPRREEGYPLLLPEACGVPAEEYTVYGNTADGAAVGEKTRNLFDIPSEFTWTQFFMKKVNIPAGTYSLTWASRTAGGTESPVIHFEGNNLTYWMTETSRSRVVKLTTPETKLIFYTNGYDYAGSAGITSTVNQLMLATDNTGKYEPYGYKIPLVNGEKETVLYLPAPLGEGETVNSTEASLPPLPLQEGTNQITAATATPPAKIRVDYRARVKT